MRGSAHRSPSAERRSPDPPKSEAQIKTRDAYIRPQTDIPAHEPTIKNASQSECQTPQILQQDRQKIVWERARMVSVRQTDGLRRLDQTVSASAQELHGGNIICQTLVWLTMALLLIWTVSRPSLWSVTDRNFCRRGRGLSLCDRRGSAHWIELSLSLHRNHTAAEFFARLLIRLTVALHPGRTVSRLGFWSVAVRTVCRRDRRKPPCSAGRVIMGRNVLHPLGSGMQATPSPRASPHCPLKMGNSQRKALRGELLPTAINESKRFP